MDSILWEAGSERTAVGTIAHELNHVRAYLRTGRFTSEGEAEAPGMAAERNFR
jgi:hypothetical protein